MDNFFGWFPYGGGTLSKLIRLSRNPAASRYGMDQTLTADAAHSKARVGFRVSGPVGRISVRGGRKAPHTFDFEDNHPMAYEPTIPVPICNYHDWRVVQPDAVVAAGPRKVSLALGGSIAPTAHSLAGRRSLIPCVTQSAG